VLSRKWQMKVDPFTCHCVEMLFAAIGNSMVAVFNRRISSRGGDAPRDAGCALSRCLWIVGRLHSLHLAAQTCAHSKVATYAYVNPLVAVFLGWLVLSERLDAYMFAERSSSSPEWRW